MAKDELLVINRKYGLLKWFLGRLEKFPRSHRRVRAVAATISPATSAGGVRSVGRRLKGGIMATREQCENALRKRLKTRKDVEDFRSNKGAAWGGACIRNDSTWSDRDYLDKNIKRLP